MSTAEATFTCDCGESITLPLKLGSGNDFDADFPDGWYPGFDDDGAHVRCPQHNPFANAGTNMPISPQEIAYAIRRVVPDETAVDAISAIMLGPHALEVKARRASDGQWYQGIVPRHDWTPGISDRPASTD